MPLIDVRCQSCETVSEVHRPLAMHPATPVCPKCDGATEQIHLPRSARVNPPAVVVYKCPDGTFRFPGDDSDQSLTAKRYAELGYERVEARGWAEVRRVEQQVSKQQASEIRRRVERQCEQHERQLSERRGEIRRSLEQGFQMPETDSRGRPTGRMRTVRFSEEARGLMKAAMERNDSRPGPKSFDSGFHVSVYSDDRSNRDDARRPDGKRGRD